MAVTALISIVCPDRVGLVANVAGCLFDLGGNLGDTTFAVLGGGAEMTSICELPNGTELKTVEATLKSLDELRDADVAVRPFGMDALHGPSGKVTHRIVVSGGDRPGLIARLCEVFVEFKANVVRLHAERVPAENEIRYSITAYVWIPQGFEESCLATIANTAGELGLDCESYEGA